MTVFGFVYLLSCVAFKFIDVLKLLTLEVYIIFNLIYYLRVYRLLEMKSGNLKISLLF